MWIAVAPTLIVSCMLSNDPTVPNHVHSAALGAPENQSCVTCHNVGGDDGVVGAHRVRSAALGTQEAQSCVNCHNVGGDDGVVAAHRVRSDALGAPEAQSCVTCHNGGGDDGVADVHHNIFQSADGVNGRSRLQRTPPAMVRTVDR